MNFTASIPLDTTLLASLMAEVLWEFWLATPHSRPRLRPSLPSRVLFISPAPQKRCAPQSISIPCSPGRTPLPVIEFHGSKDTTIPYSGGPRKTACLPAIPHWVEEWSIRQGYGLTNKTTNLFGNMVQKYEYGAGMEVWVL